jgi:lipoic acid synthetase
MPEEFARWRSIGMELGFRHVESSPLTRSSYHARQQTEEKPEEAAEASLVSAR